MKVIGLLVLAGLAGFTAFAVPRARARRRIRAALPAQSTEELKACFGQPSHLHCLDEILLELKRRNDDLSFSLPVLIDMALAGGSRGLAGRRFLQIHFSHLIAQVALAGWRLSPAARAQLLEVREHVRRGTVPPRLRDVHSHAGSATEPKPDLYYRNSKRSDSREEVVKAALLIVLALGGWLGLPATLLFGDWSRTGPMEVLVALLLLVVIVFMSRGAVQMVRDLRQANVRALILERDRLRWGRWAPERTMREVALSEVTYFTLRRPSADDTDTEYLAARVGDDSIVLLGYGGAVPASREEVEELWQILRYEFPGLAIDVDVGSLFTGELDRLPRGYLRTRRLVRDQPSFFKSRRAHAEGMAR